MCHTFNIHFHSQFIVKLRRFSFRFKRFSHEICPCVQCVCTETKKKCDAFACLIAFIVHFRKNRYLAQLTNVLLNTFIFDLYLIALASSVRFTLIYCTTKICNSFFLRSYSRLPLNCRMENRIKTHTHTF